MELNKEQAQKLIEAANNFSKALEPYAKEKTADELLLEEAERRGYAFGQTINRDDFSAYYYPITIACENIRNGEFYISCGSVYLGGSKIYEGKTKKWAKIIKDPNKNITVNKKDLFKITIYKYTETLESLVVEFDSYEKAESYGSGIYDGLRLAGKEPTGQQVTKI